MTTLAARAPTHSQTHSPTRSPSLSPTTTLNNTNSNRNSSPNTNANTNTTIMTATTPNTPDTNKRQTSPSPSRAPSVSQAGSRLSFGSKISALGAKITRTLGGVTGDGGSPTTPTVANGQGGDGHDTASLGGGATGFYGYGYVYNNGKGREVGEAGDSVSEILYRKERSTSRGRDAFQSTGRGGLGNIRAASASRDRPSTGPDDFSVTRGREPVAHQATGSPQVFSTGRGGAGNLRSPSRQPKDATLVEEEQDVIREYVASQEHAVHSSGRGGIGNMNRSRSRDPTSTSTNNPSRSPAPVGRFSTGRGGAGNILAGGAESSGELLEADEEERKKIHDASGGGIHSTGRGGTANLTSAHEPPVEHHAHPHAHGEFESTGRGGAGNIHERD